MLADKGFLCYFCHMTNTETITIPKSEYLTLKDKEKRVELLEYQLKEMKRLVFGAKKERFVPPDSSQLSLFKLDYEKTEKPVKKEKINYTRTKPEPKKKKPLRAELPSHLPRKEEVIEPKDIPSGAKKIGETITEILEYEPANIYVKRYIRPKYIVDSNDEQTNISIAELPSLPIPRGNAGPGLLSYLITSKYVDHLPFYRQVQMLKRQGAEIAESTIGSWFNATCKLMLPLYEEIKKQIIATDYLMADETPIPVLTKDKPGATHKGYLWVYYCPEKRLVLFDYKKSRARDGPEEFLKNFSGYLQTDGYKAYENLKTTSKVTHLACMAHARRKFEHALDNDPHRAEQALLMFQDLYFIERNAREQSLDFDQVKEFRREKALPVLNKMKDWLDKNHASNPPMNNISKAISYTLNLWPRLTKYVEDGRFYIDNNLVENSIRPVALGRKNYLFAGSHDSAINSAMIYSFLGTCKIKNIEPYAWLKDTLTALPDHPANRLSELLP